MLNDKPPPVGDVTVMVPVAVEQVGCVILTVGAEGIVGAVLITALVALDIHPLLFFTVTL